MLRLAVSGVAAAVAGRAPARNADPVQFAVTHPELIHILKDARLVHELGLAYRARFPHEAHPGALYAAIACAVPARGNGRQLHAQLQHRIREDFRQGRTVQLDGWILALTEARQCALYSLLQA